MSGEIGGFSRAKAIVAIKDQAKFSQISPQKLMYKEVNPSPAHAFEMEVV